MKYCQIIFWSTSKSVCLFRSTLTLSWFWFVPKPGLPEDGRRLRGKHGAGETAVSFSAVSACMAAPPQLRVWQTARICNLVAMHTVLVSAIESASLWVPRSILGNDEGSRSAWTGVWLLPAVHAEDKFSLWSSSRKGN